MVSSTRIADAWRYLSPGVHRREATAAEQASAVWAARERAFLSWTDAQTARLLAVQAQVVGNGLNLAALHSAPSYGVKDVALKLLASRPWSKLHKIVIQAALEWGMVEQQFVEVRTLQKVTGLLPKPKWGWFDSGNGRLLMDSPSSVIVWGAGTPLDGGPRAFYADFASAVLAGWADCALASADLLVEYADTGQGARAQGILGAGHPYRPPVWALPVNLDRFDKVLTPSEPGKWTASGTTQGQQFEDYAEAWFHVGVPALVPYDSGAAPAKKAVGAAADHSTLSVGTASPSALGQMFEGGAYQSSGYATHWANMGFDAEVVNKLEGTLSGILDEGLNPKNATDRIKDLFATEGDERGVYNRARLVAQTELNAARNFGKVDQWRSSGWVTHKVWSSARDGSTRKAHRLADKQTVPIEGRFRVGPGPRGEYGELDHPGDWSGGAWNTCNCRCTSTPKIVPPERPSPGPGTVTPPPPPPVTPPPTPKIPKPTVSRIPDVHKTKWGVNGTPITAEEWAAHESTMPPPDEVMESLLEVAEREGWSVGAAYHEELEARSTAYTAAVNAYNRNVYLPGETGGDAFLRVSDMRRDLLAFKEAHEADMAKAAKHLPVVPKEERGRVLFADTSVNKTGNAQALDRVYELVSKKNLRTSAPEFMPQPPTELIEIEYRPMGRGESRAYCVNTKVNQSSRVHVSGKDSLSTRIHETGHAWEDANAEVRMAAQRFLARRGAGDKARRLKSLYPNARYGASEIAVPDRYERAYVGKVYGKRYFGDIGPTEVVSMGLEYMAKEPAHFAAIDPDYFRFMWTIMHGNPALAG